MSNKLFESIDKMFESGEDLVNNVSEENTKIKYIGKTKTQGIGFGDKKTGSGEFTGLTNGKTYDATISNGVYWIMDDDGDKVNVLPDNVEWEVLKESLVETEGFEEIQAGNGDDQPKIERITGKSDLMIKDGTLSFEFGKGLSGYISFKKDPEGNISISSIQSPGGSIMATIKEVRELYAKQLKAIEYVENYKVATNESALKEDSSEDIELADDVIEALNNEYNRNIFDGYSDLKKSYESDNAVDFVEKALIWAKETGYNFGKYDPALAGSLGVFKDIYGIDV